MTDTRTLTLELGREQTAEIIAALRATRNDLADALESKAARTFAAFTNGTDEAAAAHADGAEITHRAADALADLASLVESGSVRLTSYPSTLPSLDELAGEVYAIETARALSHDQLIAFGRIAGDAAMGHFVDGFGACSSLALQPAPQAGWAHVLASGEFVASISPGGDVHYETAEGRVIS